MSKSKFNAHRDIRIDRVKAHYSYLRPRKPKIHHRDERDYADYHDAPPWELGAIKNLQKGPPKFNMDKERLFDTKEDGKLLPVKKETRKDKMSRAYIQLNSKKYHSIGSKIKPLPK